MNLFNTSPIAIFKNSITFALPLTPKNKVTILNNPFNEVEVRGYGFKRVLFLDMEAKEKALELFNKMNVIHYVNLGGKNKNSKGLPVSMHYSQIKKCAIICVENEYNALREQLFNLRACGVIESSETYLKRIQDLIDEEAQVKHEIQQL